MTTLGLESSVDHSSSEGLFYYHRNLKSAGQRNPVLVLIHGYLKREFPLKSLTYFIRIAD
jgi:hypothetical protein